jgi:hypothetical protein
MNKKREAALFIFFAVVVLVRIVLETAVFSKRHYFGYFVTLHHFSWYMFVFFYFCLCSRHILGMKIEKIRYIALLSPVIFVPIIHSLITEKKLALEYLRGNIFSVLYDFATLYKFNKKNSEFFYEMLILLAFFVIGSWLVTKDFRRTLLNVLFGFYGSMIFAGLHLFGVYPRTKAYFRIHTSLKNHQLMALIYFALAMLVFLIYNLPENKKRFLENKLHYLVVVIIGSVFSIGFNFFFFESLYGKVPKTADMFLLMVPFTVSAVAAFSIGEKVSRTLRAGKFFPVFLIIFSSLIVGGIYCGIY